MSATTPAELRVSAPEAIVTVAGYCCVVASGLPRVKVTAFPSLPVAAEPSFTMADEYLTQATRFVQSVLALSRPVPIPVEPASVVHQVIRVVEAAGRHIHVIEEPAGRVFWYSCDPSLALVS